MCMYMIVSEVHRLAFREKGGELMHFLDASALPAARTPMVAKLNIFSGYCVVNRRECAAAARTLAKLHIFRG